jgi:hypothetical protein
VINRKQFDIGREQLVTTSRLLEQAEAALLGESNGQPVTLNLLAALQSLLEARNTLISTWVSYETARLNLYRDFDLMDIDANGIWTNEHDPQLLPTALRIASEAPAARLSIPVGLFDVTGSQREEDANLPDVKSSEPGVDVPDESRERTVDGPLTERDLEPPPVPAGPPATPSPFAPAPR